MSESNISFLHTHDISFEVNAIRSIENSRKFSGVHHAYIRNNVVWQFLLIGLGYIVLRDADNRKM